MGHIGKLSGHGIRHHLVSGIVLVPAAVNQYQLAEAVYIGESVKVNKHPVLVGRYVVAVAVHEVKHHRSVFIYGVVIVPVAYHYLQFLPLI